MKIATYDNLNSHIAKHNDFVDYSSQNEVKTEKITDHIANYEKNENNELKAEIEELKFRNRILIIALTGITFMSLLV